MWDIAQAIREGNVEEAETILKKEIEKNPKSIELWTKLCLTELQFPFEDEISALSCIEEIYKLSPLDANTLLLEAEIRNSRWGGISEELLLKLKMIRGSNDIMAMSKYEQSKYYNLKGNKEIEKKCILESIEYCSQFCYPYKRLGWILEKEGKIEESKEAFRKALANVKKIYYGKEFYDFTDIQTYFNEFIRGTEITDINYDVIKEHLS